MERARRVTLALGCLLAWLATDRAALHAQATPASAAAAITAAAVPATAWLKLLDQGSFAESWRQASPAFQKAVTQADWERGVAQARSAYEPFGERRLIGAVWANDPAQQEEPERVTFQYQVRVKGDRTLNETVTLSRASDGKWRGLGYFIKP